MTFFAHWHLDGWKKFVLLQGNQQKLCQVTSLHRRLMSAGLSEDTHTVHQYDKLV